MPIVYDVERTRDGRSFTTRRVVALQKDKPIFSMSVSFQVEEAGLEHQISMPVIAPPEDLPSEAELQAMVSQGAAEPIKRYWLRERPFEIRPTDLRHYVSRELLEPVQHIWIRAKAPLPDDPDVHRCVLAYASDMMILDTSLFAHGRSVFDRDIQAASP